MSYHRLPLHPAAVLGHRVASPSSHRRWEVDFGVADGSVSSSFFLAATACFVQFFLKHIRIKLTNPIGVKWRFTFLPCSNKIINTGLDWNLSHPAGASGIWILGLGSSIRWTHGQAGGGAKVDMINKVPTKSGSNRDHRPSGGCWSALRSSIVDTGIRRGYEWWGAVEKKIAMWSSRKS